jgi:H+/Cl- antiporter ClcA
MPSVIISAVSLAGGASLGPEMALSNIGGGLATCIHEYVIEIEDLEYRELMTLSGMAAALGALFPSPLLGVLLIIELGSPPKSFMEGAVMMSITATIAFGLYYYLQPLTFLDHSTSNTIYLSEQWIIANGFQDYQIVYGFIIGVVSAGVCLMTIVSFGTCKQVMARIKERYRRNSFLKEVIPATVGGLIIGAVNYALPATIGNGNLVIGYFIKFGGAGGTAVLSKSLLYKTLFARMLTLGISNNCGFVGGIVYPFLTIGVICAVLCNQYYPGMPLGLCVSTFFISVGMGVIPAPFTFVILSCLLFFLGAYQSVVVFVAALTCFCLVSG